MRPPRIALIVPLGLLSSACAAGPTHVSLANAGIERVAIVAPTQTIPCGTKALDLEVVAWAKLPGAEQAASFSSSHRAAPEKRLDLSDFEVRASDSIVVERGWKMALDPFKGALVGYTVSVRSKSTPAREATIYFAPDLSCHRDVGEEGAAGVASSPHGAPGPNLVVHVTKAETRASGEVIFAIVEQKGRTIYAVAPISGPLTFRSRGGDGAPSTGDAPGGAGGPGGFVDVLVDERFPELEKVILTDAPGGIGGAGSGGRPSGRNGSPGAGTIRLADVAGHFAARRDLPEDGLTLAKRPAPVVTPPPPPPPRPSTPAASRAPQLPIGPPPRPSPPPPPPPPPRPPSPTKPGPRPVTRPIFIPPPPKPKPVMEFQSRLDPLSGRC